MRLILILACLFGGVHAAAVLGQNRASMDTYVRTNNAQRATTAHGAYTVHTLVSDACTLKEYENPDGKIFAVRWEGITPPNLQNLFGDYYTAYDKAHSAALKGPHPRQLQIKTDNLIVQHSGHMRHLSGLAYDPALVPAGVVAEELP